MEEECSTGDQVLAAYETENPNKLLPREEVPQQGTATMLAIEVVEESGGGNHHTKKIGAKKASKAGHEKAKKPKK